MKTTNKNLNFETKNYLVIDGLVVAKSPEALAELQAYEAARYDIMEELSIEQVIRDIENTQIVIQDAKNTCEEIKKENSKLVNFIKAILHK